MWGIPLYLYYRQKNLGIVFNLVQIDVMDDQRRGFGSWAFDDEMPAGTSLSVHDDFGHHECCAQRVDFSTAHIRKARTCSQLSADIITEIGSRLVRPETEHK
jgi:hypothetical protein